MPSQLPSKIIRRHQASVRRFVKKNSWGAASTAGRDAGVIAPVKWTSSAAEADIDGLHQPRRHHRLSQRGADGRKELADLIDVQPRHDDDPREHGRIALQQKLHHGGPADPRQNDVEEHDGVVVLAEQVDGLLSVHRLVDVASALFEEVPEELPRGLFVFHDQGSRPHLRKCGAKGPPDQCFSMKPAARSTARAMFSRSLGLYEWSPPASQATSIDGESS